jgi:hypothetical protein
MYFSLHVVSNVFVQFYPNLEFPDRFHKSPISNFMQNHPVAAKLMHVERQMARNDNLANAPKKQARKQNPCI